MIYTRKGDDGKTSLIGGERVWKCDARVEAYGTVDELNAHLGALKDATPYPEQQQQLLGIQRTLFVIQSLLAAKQPEKHDFLPALHPEEATRLEQEIDRMEQELPPFRAFILAGGHPLISQCHVARCVCRRAERRLVELELQEDGVVQPDISKYLNRLSDYLFVLARFYHLKLSVKEQTWEG